MKPIFVKPNSILRSRPRWLLAVAVTSALASAGCQQKMADQPSFKPLEPSTFFGDDRSARPLVPGTVARGHLRVDTAMFTGRWPDSLERSTDTPTGGISEDDAFVDEFPIPVKESMIVHGYHRYMIYCVVCHDALGTGRGKIVERGYTAPPSFHIDRLHRAPVGRLFAVITEGYGSMPSYAAQIPPADRWAIVAYVRALQLSQYFPEEQLTPEMRRELASAAASAPQDAGTVIAPAEGVP